MGRRLRAMLRDDLFFNGLAAGVYSYMQLVGLLPLLRAHILNS